jgi:hypothetical protein
MDSEAKKEPGPLLMRDVLQGLGIYDPHISTIFTVTIPTGARYDAQVEWLRKQLPYWRELLLRKSGANAVDTTENGKEFEVSDTGSLGQNERAKLIARLWIPGGINKELIGHERMRTVLPGQLKKILAEEIMENFPPPFEIKNPSFAADCECTFFIKVRRPFYRWEESELLLARNGTYRRLIGDFLGKEKANITTYKSPEDQYDPISFGCYFHDDLSANDFNSFKKRLLESMVNGIAKESWLNDELTER